MGQRNIKILVAVALWGLAALLFAPAVSHLASLEAPESDFLQCYPEFNPVYADEDYAVLEGEYAEQFRDNLANADDPDAQLMYLLVENNGRIKAADLDSLATLYQQYPQSGLIAAQYISACATEPANAACDDQQIDSMLQTHSDNAALWANRALLSFAREDELGAKVAMRRAADAPNYDDYWTDQLQVFQSYSPANFNLPRLSTAFYFFNYTDTTIGLRSLPFATTLCAEYAVDDPLIAQACMDYGEKVIASSETIIGVSLGYAIQEVTHRALGNQQAALQTDLARQRFRQSLPSVNGWMGLMTYDEELADFWVQSLVEFGEVDAQERIVAEIARRSANPQYQPCEPPGLRFAFPYFYVGDERVVW